jgi:predicted histone-like DNA-binding protein
MAIVYKVYQNNRTNFKNKGKWYARAYHANTVNIDDLADIMQNNCTVKRSDIVAVISELVETMKTALQNSNKVKLQKFGTFKIGLNTTGAETLEKFNVQQNIKGMHVLFQPETTIDIDGKRQRVFLNGATVTEAANYLYNAKKKTGTTVTPGA